MIIIIKGDPRTKKNSMRIVRAGGFNKLIPSAQYKAYENIFIAQCIEQRIYNKNLTTKLNIACRYYMETKRKVDLTNLLSGTMDCLVAAKVINDDNCMIAFSHDGSCVNYDRANPRVEIEFTDLGGSDE